MDSLFFQIGAIITLAAVCGGVLRVLKQPIIVAYIVTGVLLGGAGLHVITDAHLTHDIAAIGIVFLLFLVGLELDIGKVRQLGRAVLLTGIAQLVLITGLGFAVMKALGYSDLTAIYFGLAATFSSTAVVLKYLGDKGDMASLPAKMTIGILLLQDVLAILALIIISGSGTGQLNVDAVAGFVAKGVGLLAITWLISKYVLGRLFFYVAKSNELLFLASIAWAFSFAMAAESLGFSREIGAFLAGLSLASLPYNLEIISRVKSLKDFFLVLFFVAIGLQVSWAAVLSNWAAIAALVAIVVVAKPLVTSLTLVRLGYPRRPSYQVGTYLGQMSEFSLLIILLGVQYKAVPSDAGAIVAALLAFSIILNTYWNSMHHPLYRVFAPLLKWFAGTAKHHELHYRPEVAGNHILLFGANRVGSQLLHSLAQLKQDVTVVDHNPEVVQRLLHRGVPAVYGDVDDYELLHEMGLAEARMVISTVANVSANLYLIQQTKQYNPQAVIIATADQPDDGLRLYDAGADYVILPHLLGGEQAAQLLEKLGDRPAVSDTLVQHRHQHIRQLRQHRAELVR